MPQDQQLAALAALEEEAAGGSSPQAGTPGGGDRAKWASDALTILKSRHQEHPTMLGLDQVFDRCASDPDLNLRKLVAFALIFWDGSPEENRNAEQTLIRLAGRDTSSGDSAALQVCYTAASALARRGSTWSGLMPLLGEMLDEPRLQKVFRVKPPQGGEEEADSVAIHATLLNGLQGLTELHSRQPGLDVSVLLPAVERLTTYPVPSVREQAQKTMKALKGS
jgi:hypothetical protein